MRDRIRQEYRRVASVSAEFVNKNDAWVLVRRDQILQVVADDGEPGTLAFTSEEHARQFMTDHDVTDAVPTRLSDVNTGALH